MMSRELKCNFCGRVFGVDTKYMYHGQKKRGLYRPITSICIYCAENCVRVVAEHKAQRQSGLNDHYWRLLNDLRKRVDG